MSSEKIFIYGIPRSKNILSNSFDLFIKSINFEFLFIDQVNELYFENQEEIMKILSAEIEKLRSCQILCYKNIEIGSNRNTYDLIVSRAEMKPSREFEMSPLMLIGHRGSGSNSKTQHIHEENTIDSFRKAYEDGAEMVELDVHLTADEEVVVYHNDVIGEKRICDLSYKEFTKLVGNEEGCTSKPTSLRHILNALESRIGINIELKNCNESDDGYLRRLSTSVCRIIKEESGRLIVFSSFSPLCCIYMRILLPNMNVFLLVDVKKDGPCNEEKKIADLVNFSEFFDLSGFVISSEYFERNKMLVHKLMDGNKRVFCYGDYTNIKKKSNELIRHGISGIITDILSVYK